MGTETRKSIRAVMISRLRRPITYESPARVLVVTLVALLLAEAGILVIHFLLPSFGLEADIAIDLILFVVLVGPILFIVLIYPLLSTLDRYKKALLDLEFAREELKGKVYERTAALEEINRSLMAQLLALEQADQRIRLQMAALESAADGIVITDRLGIIEWCNPSMSRMTGYAIDELVGSRMSLLKSGMHPSEFYTDMWESITAGKTWQGVLHNRCKDGSYYYEEQTITPVVGLDGNISRFVAVKHDITERKQTEEELLHHNWELQTLNVISGQVNQYLRSDQIFHSLGRLLSGAIPNLGGAVFSPGEAPGVEVVEAAWTAAGRMGDPPAAVVPDPARAAVAWAMIEKKVIIFKDEAARAEPLPASAGQAVLGDQQSLPAVHIVTPFLFDGQSLGALWLGFDSLEKKHAHFFEALGRQVGVGLKNAFLYQQETQSRLTAEILSSASQDLVQTLDLDHVLLKMLEYLCQAIPCERASILLREDSDRLVMRARIEDGKPAILGADFHSKPNLVGSHPRLKEILGGQQTLSIPDLRQEDDNSLLSDWPAARSLLGLPVKAGGRTIGVCVIESVQVGRFNAGHEHLAGLLIGQAAVALQNAWLFNQLRDGRAQLQLLSHRLVDIQETERRYIARELHDETSQAIINLKFGLSLLKQDIADHALHGRLDAVQTGMSELSLMIDEILQSLHKLAYNLRPASLDHLGLVPALKQLIEGYNDKHGLPIRLSAQALTERLPADTETNLYRIVQEALANTIRHARATQAEVVISANSKNVCINIQDDGTGFDPALVGQSNRLGILGMRERAEMLGGQFEIHSTPGAGTKIIVEVPHDDSFVDR